MSRFLSPLLDPINPIPAGQIQKAAREFEISESELRKRLAAEEEFLGWNPIEGARAKGLGPPEEAEKED